MSRSNCGLDLSRQGGQSENAPYAHMGLMESGQTIRAVTRIMGYGLIVLLSLVLILFMGGERFAPILDAMGLYNHERGIYADCGKPYNKDNRFCNPDAGPREYEWRKVRSGTGFSLNGR